MTATTETARSGRAKTRAGATGTLEAIRERAYYLWEAEGQPSGRHHAHWLQAEQEFGATSAPRTGGKPVANGRDAGNGEPATLPKRSRNVAAGAARGRGKAAGTRAPKAS